MVTPESSVEHYGRFDECPLSSGYNSTNCVYQCQCQIAAQCRKIHFFMLSNNSTLCGLDISQVV